MKTRLILVFAAISAAFFLTACQSQQSATVYDFSAVANDGSEVKLADYKGKVLLIVNTASKCGFTPQYEGLEMLYKKYQDKGLVVIGFPCDQFGHQEPGTNEEIVEFCRLNYGVSFPLMEKIEVNGENAHPIYKWLGKAFRRFRGRGDRPVHGPDAFASGSGLRVQPRHQVELHQVSHRPQGSRSRPF